MTNRLAAESSPYLRQHADNPVHWHPWDEEALALARETDRPILLSIGYSSCHWCHVMERESFEDEETAALMNELFVNVKVDREERPDVDQVYMKAVQAMTGGGGWPLTAWLTPEGVPFYGGTYFPPEPRHGMPSFRQVLRATAEAYRTRPEDVREAGARLVEAIRRATEPTAEPDGRSPEAGAASTTGDPRSEAVAGTRLLDAAWESLERAFEERWGGFGSAPKFPQPVTLEIVLRRWARTGDERAGRVLLHTLERMAAGGLRDHLSGGFHRYSVDARWLVPHFEKMLYDNALLARLYLDAFRVSGEPAMRAVAEETLDWLLTEMRAPEGGFYTALDADSEGEEGRYYVWSADEIERVLGPDRASVFGAVYGVSEAGNCEGRNVLHLARGAAEVAAREGIDETELARRLAEDRARLLEVRRERIPPFRDEKILTGQNAMALRAFAEAGAALGRPDWVRAAAEGAGFLLDALRPEGRLHRVWIDDEARIPGFLEDHAALGNALLSLHGATLDPGWLEPARWAADEVLARFRDPGSGAFFDVADDQEGLLVRPRDPLDNATPSGPSLAVELLVRAAQLFDEPRYREAAEQALRTEAAPLTRYGSAYGRLLASLDRARAVSVEIALVGDPEEGGPAGAAAAALVRAAHERFLRNVAVAGKRPGEAVTDLPLLAGRDAPDGRPTAWVCSGYACRLPVHDADALRAEVGRILEDGAP